MRGLYALVDVETLERRGLDPVRFAASILSVRPAAIQLRDKTGGGRRTLERLRAIAPLATVAGTPLFANDRPDLALLASCDGVHLGQDDVPARLAKRLARGSARPGLRVGLSTHDASQIDEALSAGADGPDYLAVGPVFPTASKADPSPTLGLDGLVFLSSRIRAARADLPIVAIGGITATTAGAVGAIVDCAAVIGALLPDPQSPSPYEEAAERARAIHTALLLARRSR
jgi:thiamine-phosphate pyrophosphorylase